MDDRDLRIGELDSRVELDDRRVVPFGDLAQIDVRKHGAGQLELARLDALQVDDRHIATDDRRKLQQPILVEFLGLERHVRRSEIHGLVLDLLDAAAGADRLVVHADTGLRLVGFGPLGVDGIREGRSRAGDVERVRADAESDGGSAEERSQTLSHAHRGVFFDCNGESLSYWRMTAR